MKKQIILLILVVTFGLIGCVDEKPKSTKITQSDKALKAAESITFTENAEIDNIKARLKLTSDPGLTGFVLLMNEAGQPIMYTGIVGKITSSGKRLTPPYKVTRWDHGSNYGDKDRIAPSDEGT